MSRRPGEAPPFFHSATTWEKAAVKGRPSADLATAWTTRSGSSGLA